MKLEPRNRHLLVEKVEREEVEEKTNVLLPEGYKKVEEHTLLRILATSPDCSITARKGEKIVVPTHLIQNINSCWVDVGLGWSTLRTEYTRDISELAKTRTFSSV